MAKKYEVDSLRPLDAKEREGQEIFKAWYDANGAQGFVDSKSRFPAVRPQGYTVSLPDAVLSEMDIFPLGYDVALTVHPRYFTAVPHSHTFFELTFILSGHSRLFVDGKEAEMNVGDVCVLPPGIPHSMEAFNENDIAVNLQLRASSFLENFSALMNANSVISGFFHQAFYGGGDPTHYLIFQTGNSSPALDILLEMLTESRAGGSYSAQLLNAYASAFFAMLLRHHFSSVRIMPISGAKPNDALAAMLSYIEENIKTITLGDAAKKFHYSETYISRLLGRYTGMNFRNLIRGIRLDKAKQLLRETDLPVPEVAAQLGYSGVSELYRAFSISQLPPPAQFRKEARGK